MPINEQKRSDVNNKEHTSFYKNTAWQYGLQIAKYLFPLITLPYLTRVLEPDGYAIYAYVLSLMTFAQTFVDFGFNLSGTKSIASAKSVEEENRIVGAVTQARLLLCSVSAVIVLAVALIIPITAANLLYTMLAFVAVCGKALAPDFLFQGHENMGPMTTRYVVSKGVSTVLTFVMVHSIGDIIWIPILDILSSTIALIWSFGSAKRLFGTTIEMVLMARSFYELRRSALYCFSNMAATVFTGFTTLLIGIVISDMSQISYWSLAMTAVGVIQSLYAPIINSLYPHMVKSEDYRFVKKLAFIALPVIVVGTLLFALLSNVVMLILGGEEYLEGSWVVATVSPVLFFSFFATLQGWPILGAAGNVKELTTTTVVSSIFCIVSLTTVALLGISSMGLICAVRVITEAILCFSRTYYLRKLMLKSRDNSMQ